MCDGQETIIYARYAYLLSFQSIVHAATGVAQLPASCLLQYLRHV